jgi:hypothetical protein
MIGSFDRVDDSLSARAVVFRVQIRGCSVFVPSGRVVTAGRDARFARTARYRVEGDGGGALRVPAGSGTDTEERFWR